MIVSPTANQVSGYDGSAEIVNGALNGAVEICPRICNS